MDVFNHSFWKLYIKTINDLDPGLNLPERRKMIISVKRLTKYVIIIYALGSGYESLASKVKPFQSRFKVETLGWDRREERLSRSILKQAFLIDSDAELFMYLFQCTCIRFSSRKVRRLNRD